MAKTYTSTIKLSCVKEHTCLSCGSIYAYLFNRKVVGTSGRSAEAASQAARANVTKTLERDVDMESCPTCGLMQPDMIGQQRAKRLRIVAWLLVAVPAVTLMILGANDVFRPDKLAWYFAALAAVTALLFLTIQLSDPNRDLAKNMATAAKRVASGKVIPGTADPSMLQPVVIGRSPLQNLVLLLMVLSIPLAASAELLRTVRHWPLNEACYPPVAGPGDKTRVYMTDTIRSLKGYWRGEPDVFLKQAEVANATVLKADATSSQTTWGSSISFKSDEKQSSSTPYADLTLPAVAGLAGETVDCAIGLHLTYPYIQSGEDKFEVIETNMDRRLQLNLGPAGAGRAYHAAWWGGTAGSTAVLFLGGLLLLRGANKLRDQKTMTKTYAKPE